MSAGLSKERLERMHGVMAGYVERGEMPGLVTLVGRRGEIHVDAIGTASVGGKAPMRSDTIMRVSSMTKPVTAVAAMILVEECVLRLDDPIDGLLPELADRRVLTRVDAPVDDTVPANRPLTLRDLLTFRMGHGMLISPEPYPIHEAISAAGFEPGPPFPSREPPTDEWISRLGALPLVYQPGERWMYHTGAEVAGVLISRAAGQPLETFMRERIFEPLQMKDTAFSVPADKMDRFATSYWNDPLSDAFAVYDEAEGGAWSRPPAFESGGAGLVSTAEDFAAFGQMMLSKGTFNGHRILSRSTIELMTSDQITAEQAASSFFLDGRGWGLGMSVITRRDHVGGSVGTFGWDGGLGTSWYVDPREEMFTILMTQRAWTSAGPPTVLFDFLTSAYAAIDD